MGIPPLEDYKTVTRWIRKKRKEKDITQRQLEERTGVGNSHISKIESREVENASYRKIRRLVEELRDSPEENNFAEKISTEDIEWARPTDKREDVVDTMIENDFSQLPIRNEDGEHVGAVTESCLIDSEGDTVEEFMEGKLLELSPDTSRKEIKGIIKHNSAALVQNDGDYVGIITKTNLIENPVESPK